MDLNQLYFDHQALQMRARAATSPDLKRAHCRDAADIAGKIGSLQNLLGATAAPGWMAIAARKAANDATSICTWIKVPGPELADTHGGRSE